MRRLKPGKLLQVLLEFYEDRSGPVEYVLFEHQDQKSASEDTHRKAAIMALNQLHQDNKRKFPEMAFRLAVHPTRARLWPIDYCLFIGPPEHTPLDDEDDQANPNGYLAAFSSGPHGPNITPRETQGLFRAINEQLFGESQLSIFRWSTDWSNYYDAGHEWWGAYHWTVDIPGERRIVSISASETD